MQYFKLFDKHEDYESYINSENKKLPNLCYCIDAEDVHFNLYNWTEAYLTTVTLENGTISFNIWKSMGTDMITSISYSTDNGETWTTTANQDNKSENRTIDVNVNTGDKVLWKGIATQTGYYDEDDYGTGVGSFFSSDCEFDVKGNVMSLLYGDNFKGQTTINEDFAFCCLFYDYDDEKTCSIVNAKDLSLPATTLTDECYSSMFIDCTSLVTAPSILPATTLALGCYSGMFAGCTSLVTVPELPATTLAQICYSSMFGSCTSLVTAPELPATTLAPGCYSSMFGNCTSLVTAPELPATTLTEGCYDSMFGNCTSLVTAPSILPATTLVQGCYSNMFVGCTSLVTAPVLPATTLIQSCYSYMFKDCTSLVIAPVLPAITLATDCYGNMFFGCTSLNYIKAMFTTIPSSNYTREWVNGVAATGTFIKNSEAPWNVSGSDAIPTGWTVQTASE